MSDEFGRIAAAIDEAERIAGERIGGPTDAELGAIRRMEARLYALRPLSAADLRRHAGRLSLALVNGWSEEAFMPLVRMVGDPLTVGCKI